MTPLIREQYPLMQADLAAIAELRDGRAQEKEVRDANRIAKMKLKFAIKAVPKDGRWDSARNRWSSESELRARGLKMRDLERKNLAAGKRGGSR